MVHHAVHVEPHCLTGIRLRLRDCGGSYNYRCTVETFVQVIAESVRKVKHDGATAASVQPLVLQMIDASASAGACVGTAT